MTDWTNQALIEAELNWTINDDWTIEETAEVVEEVAEVEEVVEEVKEEVKEVEEVKPEPTKKSDSVAKILKQRNEARAKVKELEQKWTTTDDLAKKVAEMEETMATQALEAEEKIESADFFAKNPNAKEFEENIKEIRTEKDLSYDEAFQLYAAQNNPALLMDEQYRNKSTSTTNLNWVTKVETMNKANPTVEDLAKMTDDEVLDWSNAQAKRDRASKGFSN